MNRLDAIEERARAATPGPWACEGRWVGSIGVGQVALVELGQRDGPFIAHARSDVPMLARLLRNIVDCQCLREIWTEHERIPCGAFVGGVRCLCIPCGVRLEFELCGDKV